MSLLIHEVAAGAEVSKDTVRRAERRGLITSERDVNGWRRYAAEVVPILRQAYRKDAREANHDAR